MCATQRYLCLITSASAGWAASCPSPASRWSPPPETFSPASGISFSSRGSASCPAFCSFQKREADLLADRGGRYGRGGEADRRHEAAGRTVLQSQRSAMRLGDGVSERKAEPCAAGLAAA